MEETCSIELSLPRPSYKYIPAMLLTTLIDTSVYPGALPGRDEGEYPSSQPYDTSTINRPRFMGERSAVAVNTRNTPKFDPVREGLREIVSTTHHELSNLASVCVKSVTLYADRGDGKSSLLHSLI